MSKTLSTNISAGKAGASEPVYLVSMSLDPSTSLLLATKDTDDITGWSGSHYLGGYLESLGTIDMLVDLAKGPGIYKTYDFEFAILNQDDFHESLIQYDFYNRSVEIRMIFADKTGPSWANAVPLFKGIVRDWSYSKQRIIIKCTSNDKVWLERQLPLTVFTADQFIHCPSGNLGKPIPLIWGQFAEPDSLYQFGGDLVKAYKVDDKFNIYMASSHDLMSYGHAYYWSDNLKEACEFSGIVNGAYTFTGSAIASYYWVYDPRITIISRILSLVDAVNGNDFVTDGYKVFDFSIDTSIRLSKLSSADKLLSRLVDMKVDGASAIYLCFECAWSNMPNLFDRLVIYIYADNFESTAFVDGTFGDDHDIYEIDWDVTATWKASSKSNIGIRVSFQDGGSNNYCDLKELLVRVEDAAIESVPDWILVPPNGMMFGSWIDYIARNNDLSQWGVICRGSYVIESILHEIGLAQNEIDYEAFDNIAGSSSADRYDWKLAGQLAIKSTVRDLLSKMAMQNGAIVFEDCEGKLTIMALKAAATPAATLGGESILVDEANESTLQRSLTDLDDVKNSFELSYKLNYATGEYDGFLYCNQAGKSDSIASGYDTLCATSVSKYSNEKKLSVQADWIRDEATAILYIQYLVDWFTKRRELIEFDTSLLNVDLEIGDVRTIDDGFVGGVFMLYGIQHDCEKDIIHTRWIQLDGVPA